MELRRTQWAFGLRASTPGVAEGTKMGAELGRGDGGRIEQRAFPLQLLFLGGAYYLTAVLSLRVALVEGTVTPIWLPTGVAVVALFLFGNRLWPAITIAAFAVNAPITPSLLTAGAIAFGNTLAPLLATSVLRIAGFRPSMDRLRDALAVFTAALAGMLVSATIGASALVLGSGIRVNEFAGAWSVWWAGDAMGVLIFAPVLFLVKGKRPVWCGWGRALETGLVFGGLGAAALISFTARHHLLYIVFPFIIWAASRFHQLGAAPAAVVASGTAVWAALVGVGPFETGTLLDKMLLLQAYNGSVALTAYFLAALSAERDAAHDGLRLAGERLEVRVQERMAELSVVISQLESSERRLAEAQRVAHVGSWEWDIATDKVTWTDELFRLFGLEPQSIDVNYSEFLARVHPEDRDRVREIVERAFGDHQPFAMDHRVISPNGRERLIHGLGRVILDSGGRPVTMAGTAQDFSDRKRAAEYEQRLREAGIRRKQALELNDEIVQGLSAARYAIQAGEDQRARQVIEGTLNAAKGIVTDLLVSEDGLPALDAGSLVREHAAQVPGRVSR